MKVQGVGMPETAEVKDEDIICEWVPNGPGVRVTLVHVPTGVKVHGCAQTLHMALIAAHDSLIEQVKAADNDAEASRFS